MSVLGTAHAHTRISSHGSVRPTQLGDEQLQLPPLPCYERGLPCYERIALRNGRLRLRLRRRRRNRRRARLVRSTGKGGPALHFRSLEGHWVSSGHHSPPSAQGGCHCAVHRGQAHALARCALAKHLPSGQRVVNARVRICWASLSCKGVRFWKHRAARENAGSGTGIKPPSDPELASSSTLPSPTSWRE